MRLTGFRGFLIGIGVLAGMQLILSSKTGTTGFGILTNLPTRWLEDWFDPTQPLIADHSTGASASGGSSTVQDCSKITDQLQRSACVASQPSGQRQCNLLSGAAQWMCSAGIGPATSTQMTQTPTNIPTTSPSASQLSA